MRYPLRHGATCWSFRASAVLSQQHRPCARSRHHLGCLRRRSPAAAPKTPPTVTARPAGGRPTAREPPLLPKGGGCGPRVRRARREPVVPPRPRLSLPRSPPAPRPRLPAVSGGRSRPARAAEAAGPDRPLRRRSGPVRPGTSVAPASGEGERPRPGSLRGEGGDPSRAPGSSPHAGRDLRLRLPAEATSVCVLVRVYLRGASGKRGLGCISLPTDPEPNF